MIAARSLQPLLPALARPELTMSRCFPLRARTQTLPDEVGTSHFDRHGMPLVARRRWKRTSQNFGIQASPISRPESIPTP
jgi:hypothetical protein